MNLQKKYHASQVERTLSGDSYTSKPKAIKSIGAMSSDQRWDDSLPHSRQSSKNSLATTNMYSSPRRPSRSYSNIRIMDLTLDLERLTTSSPSQSSITSLTTNNMNSPIQPSRSYSNINLERLTTSSPSHNISSNFMESQNSPNVPPRRPTIEKYQNSTIHNTNFVSSDLVFYKNDDSKDTTDDDKNSIINKEKGDIDIKSQEVNDSKSILSRYSGVNGYKMITRKTLRNSVTSISDARLAADSVISNNNQIDDDAGNQYSKPLRRKTSVRRSIPMIPSDSKTLLHNQDQIMLANKEHEDEEAFIVGMEILIDNNDDIQKFELRKNMSSVSSLSSK